MATTEVTRPATGGDGDDRHPARGDAVRRRRRPRWLAHLGLIGFGLLMLYPLVWMVISSFKPTDEIFREPGLIPAHVTGENYPAGWTGLPSSFEHYILNSLVV